MKKVINEIWQFIDICVLSKYADKNLIFSHVYEKIYLKKSKTTSAIIYV